MLSYEDMYADALDVRECTTELLPGSLNVETEVHKRGINRVNQASLPRRAILDEAIHNTPVIETESVESIHHSRCFHIQLAADSRKSEAGLDETRRGTWTYMPRTGAVIELTMRDASTTRSAANVDVVVAYGILPNDVANLARETEDRGFDGVVFCAITS